MDWLHIKWKTLRSEEGHEHLARQVQVHCNALVSQKTELNKFPLTTLSMGKRVKRAKQMRLK